MITVEEKLNIFSKLIFEKVQNEADEMLEKMHLSNLKVIEEYRKKVEGKSHATINKKIRNGELKKSQMISNSSSELKKKVMNKKKELLKELIEEIKDIAREFTKKEEYQQFLNRTLINAVSSFGKGESLILYLTEEDLKVYRDSIFRLLENNGFDINMINLKTTQKEIIGGVIAVNSIKTIRIDSSLENRIEENKSYIGHKLYEEFSKVSDKDE